MVVCPSCGSTRIRNDYKLAPLFLRAVGVRALLCDYCNRQFRAFSLTSPRNRAPRTISRKLLTAPIQEQQQSKVDLTDLAMHAPQPVNGNGNGHGANGTNGTNGANQGKLRLEIARLHRLQQQAKETHDGTSIRETQRTNTSCPECGSNWVRRRQRSGLERVVFALTGHKAFICRSCDASYYARVGSEESESKILSGSAQT
jgi:hypothetical protein